MSTEAQTPETEGAPAPKKSKKPLIIIALVVLLLGGGGGGAYWWFVARPAAAPAEGEEGAEGAAHAEAKAAEHPAIVPLDAFVVNLADPGGSRYLRVTLGLVVDGEERAKELEENAVSKMKVRSSILELLALQTADKLTTPEGKTELKKAIAEHAGKSAGEETKVSDVLFSEFIVQ
jgi:flagellar FliL protein